MSHSTDFKNLNILIPAKLLSDIKIHAIQKNKFTKDTVLELLEVGLKYSTLPESKTSKKTKEIIQSERKQQNAA